MRLASQNVGDTSSIVLPILTMDEIESGMSFVRFNHRPFSSSTQIDFSCSLVHLGDYVDMPGLQGNLTTSLLLGYRRSWY